MPRQAGRFTRNNRLNRPADYQRVFQSPHRSVDDQLLVRARANGLGCARLGLVISRRRIRSAVERNHLKRLVRESFRINQHLLQGLDIVVITHKQLERVDNRILRRSLLGHWRRLAACRDSLSQ